MKIKLLTVVKKWATSTLIPLAYLISQPKSVYCSRAGRKKTLQVPVAICNDCDRMDHKDSMPGWMGQVTWTCASPGSCPGHLQVQRIGRTLQSSLPMGERCWHFSRTQAYLNKEYSLLLPTRKRTCWRDKKPKRKGKSLRGNKNRNRLRALAGKILNVSGPSMSRNISLKCNPIGRLLGFLFLPH